MGPAAHRHRGCTRGRCAVVLATAAALAAAAVVAASTAVSGGAVTLAPTADGFSDENDGALADFQAIKEATSGWTGPAGGGGSGGGGAGGGAGAGVGVPAGRVGAAGWTGKGDRAGGGGVSSSGLSRSSVEAIRSAVTGGAATRGGGRGRDAPRGARRSAYPAKATVAAAMGGSRVQRRSQGSSSVALRPVLLRARVAPGQPLPVSEGAPSGVGEPRAGKGKAPTTDAHSDSGGRTSGSGRKAVRASVGRDADEYVALPNKFWGQAHYEHERRADTGETMVRLVGQPDEFVYDTFFKHPLRREGVFVELGAVDGIKYSNTRFFEDTLDWSGLLIEGSKENFLAMYHNRPRSAKAWSAVCDTVGTKLFVGDGAAAGAVDMLSEKHLLSFGKFFKSMDPYDVPCEPLRNILARSGVSHIDLFSLDISGSEAVALRTMDWDAVSVDVLVLYPGASCTENGVNVCEAMLTKAGMCRAAKLAVNEFWVGTRALKARYCVDAVKPMPTPTAKAVPKAGAATTEG
ncbi:hypothetical protein MMPV_004325 [Pyropia vietnamensis]